jgi:CRP-like cAMP-binding protein
VKRGENGDEISLGSLRPGETFGEGGFFEEGGLHPATVRTSSDAEALRLDRTMFEALLRRRPEVRDFFELQARHRHLEYFFRQFTDLSRLPREALNALLRELEPVKVDKGEVVFDEGEPAGPMYIVEDGRFRAHAGVNGRRRNCRLLPPGRVLRRAVGVPRRAARVHRRGGGAGPPAPTHARGLTRRCSSSIPSSPTPSRRVSASTISSTPHRSPSTSSRNSSPPRRRSSTR